MARRIRQAMGKLMVALALAVSADAGASQPVGGLWTPESQGLSSRAILKWVDHADRTGGFQSFVLMRHGKTLAEGWWSPCETNGTHLLYSLSKSFTSTAVGLLADEGKLDLDERIADIFPECLPPEPSANLLSMRVRDLLTMTTGHTNDSFKAFAAAADGDWRRAFMAWPVPLRPGMRFLYDSGATYMLSSVVGRRSGQRMSDYLRSRLFDPIDIGPVVWNRSPQGDDVGGSELYLSTRDMAKFGQLWLQRGEWKGRRLLSSDYVRLASSKQTNNGLASFEGQDVREDWNAGYGFQFWMCRHNAFRGAGAYGQFVIVMRDQDAVMAINSNTSMQNTLESVWTHLLAEMKDRPLAEDPDGVAVLRNRTASLARPTVEGSRTGAADGFGPYLDRASGLKATFAAADDGWTLSMSNAEWQVSVPVGYRRWSRGLARFAAPTPCGGRLVGAQQVAASGAWQGPTEFRARLVFVQTPHDAEVAIRVGERGDLTMTCTSANVSNARISKTTMKRFK